MFLFQQRPFELHQQVDVFRCFVLSTSIKPIKPDITQEEEEEEEQSISQRGDLLDVTDQDHYKTRIEENQNLENQTNDPVKREEPDSPSATTDKQVSVQD